MKLVASERMERSFSISGRLRTTCAAMLALVLVVAQIGMSQAMAAMPDHGSIGHATHSVHGQMSSHSAHFPAKDASDENPADHYSGIPDHGEKGFGHDEQGNHCSPLCLSAMLPLDFDISSPVADELKFSDAGTFGLPNDPVGLKRPPIT